MLPAYLAPRAPFGRVCVTPERATAGDHFVGQNAQGVDVRSGIQIVAPTMLRRHVSRCSHRLHADSHRIGRLGQAEVHDEDATIFLDHHIARLQVSVQHILLVSIVYRQTDLLECPSGLLPGQRVLLVCHPTPQRDTLHIIHHDENQVVVLLNTVETNNVVVLQIRHCFGFPAEAPQEFGVVGHILPDHFDGYVVVPPVVPGFVDLGHPASSQELPNLITSFQSSTN